MRAGKMPLYLGCVLVACILAGAAELRAAESLQPAGLEKLLERAGDAGYTEADRERLVSLVCADGAKPCSILMSKAYEAIAKGVGADRALAAVESLKSRLESARKLLVECLGEEPDPQLVDRLARSEAIGLKHEYATRLIAELAAAGGRDKAGRLAALLELLDEFIARGERSEGPVNLAGLLIGKGFSADQIAAVADLVRNDFSAHEAVAASSVLEATCYLVEQGPPAIAAKAATSSGAKPARGPTKVVKPPHPPHPPHPPKKPKKK